MIQYLLTSNSAPVFSMIGFVVRVRYSTSKDVTYTQPSVLLWGQAFPLTCDIRLKLIPFRTAEVTTGILCLCFPPLQVLLHKQHYQRGPTQSILKGAFYKQRSRTWGPSPTKPKDDSLFTGEYTELGEHGGSLRTAPLKQPENVHVKIEGASGRSYDDGSITKTVSIEQNYV